MADSKTGSGYKTAFDAPRSSYFNMEPADLVIITDKTHKRYDPRVELPLDPGLVTSIDEQGVKVPVLIAKVDGAPEVIDGRQRVKAAIEVNKRRAKRNEPPVRVPCIQVKGDDAALTDTAIIVNEIRKDDPIPAKAARVRRLKEMGRTEAQIAALFGVSTTAIKQWSAWDDTAPEVKAAVNAKKISASAAVNLAKLSKADQAAKVAPLMAEDKPEAPVPAKASVDGVPPLPQLPFPVKGVKSATSSPKSFCGPWVESPKTKRKPKLTARKALIASGVSVVRTRREIARRTEDKSTPECCKRTLRWVLGAKDDGEEE